MFNKHDLKKNECMLKGGLRKKGYDWWWHSFTGRDVITGEEKAFFIEFFLCNPDLAEDYPVLGQTYANQRHRKKPSYLMVKAGCWGEDHAQLHRFFPWKQVLIHGTAPFCISAMDCNLSETATRGKITVTKEEASFHPEWMSDAGSMEWNLRIDKQIAYNVGYGTSALFRKIDAFEMYWHAEGIKTAYNGTVTYNGKEYLVTPSTSYGYADKNWGRNFTSPWVWLSSNNLVSKKTGKRLENSVFDIGGGRPKMFGVPFFKKLLGCFYYEGKEYEFNFSKFWTGSKTRFECKETNTEVIWKIIQTTKTAMLKTEVRCQKKDMLLVNYESPDGKKRHKRLWNGGNGIGRLKLYDRVGDGWELVDDILARNVGCEYGEYDK